MITLLLYNVFTPDVLAVPATELWYLLLGLQLSHVSSDEPAPVSSLNVEVAETKSLHQLMEHTGRTDGVKA